MSNKPRTSNDSRLGTALFARFTSRLVAPAAGRSHILNKAAYAEDADEGDVFEALLERLDDPELHKMVRIHQADEKRHFEARSAATALNPTRCRRTYRSSSASTPLSAVSSRTLPSANIP